jgi:hypothetical protein
MGHISTRTAIGLSLFFAAARAPGADSLVARRITSIDGSQTFLLRHNTRPAVANRLASDLGKAPNSQRMPRMSIRFRLTADQQADLEQLLRDQQDRRSAQYRKFLTPEEFGNRFGVNSADVEIVERWLANAGFSDIEVAPAKTSISFSGTVAHAESAFHVRIHKYTLGSEWILANTADPELPQGLQNVVQSVGGLSTMRATPRFTYSPCSYGCNHIAPDDWETIYDVKPIYGSGFDGTGVTIAVVGQSDVQLSDLRAFRAAANLPAKDPTILVPPGNTDPGIQNADEIESDLDLEWAGAIAKNANILFVTASATSGSGVFDSLYYAISNNVAPVVSISYGVCETQLSSADLTSFNSVLAQGAAQGMTIVAASGDNGAAACDRNNGPPSATHGLAVDFPASSPYVTAIGGTEISNAGAGYWNATNNSSNGSAISYMPEQVWNDGYGAASGGGASQVFAKPTWQTGLGVPSDGERDIPDIAFAASVQYNGMLFCGPSFCTNQFYGAGGSLDLVGGTSAGTPSFAGVVALLVQKTGGPVGNINPNLYSLAQISNNAFHDVTLGNNSVVCTMGTPNCTSSANYTLGFAAGVGYDEATGWGSIDATNLIEQWSGDIALTASPTSLTVAPGSSATATISVSPQNNFSGPVSFSCSVSSSLIDVTCSLPPGAINTQGSVTLTVTASSNATVPWWRRLPKMPALSAPQETIFFALVLLSAVSLGLRRRRWRSVPLWACVVAGLLVSCGGGGGGSSSSVAPLSLACNTPAGLLGIAYTGGCAATGGKAPYIYAVSTGSLPAGLTLDSSTGAISGTPSVASNLAIWISVSDSQTPAQTVSTPLRSFQIVTKLALVCADITPINWTAGQQLADYPCNAQGGLSPTNMVVSAGTLPPGMTSNSLSGVFSLSGIPTKAGSYTFTLTATDSLQPPQTVSSDRTIIVGPPARLQVSLSNPTAQANVAYNAPLYVTGGVPPYASSISSGALPAGLVLNASGSITGMPTVAGRSNFSITVTDSYTPQETATTAATMTILPPPPESGTVTVTATSGGIVNTATINVSVPAPAAANWVQSTRR